MSRAMTAAAGALTIVTLLTLVIRQGTALRPRSAASSRWLTAMTLVLTSAFAVAMVVRLGAAL